MLTKIGFFMWRSGWLALIYNTISNYLGITNSFSYQIDIFIVSHSIKIYSYDSITGSKQKKCLIPQVKSTQLFLLDTTLIKRSNYQRETPRYFNLFFIVLLNLTIVPWLCGQCELSDTCGIFISLNTEPTLLLWNLMP